ncbi:MAG TPA: lysylphosphatidylglycerol synthase transmembrane domain-containing protein [Pseudodesulfovibrio sp.]|nr:lysylphosphatidylglycerol synthase transmembrane domain-containing protein [Pseudodesulfovibrio sp.]
MRRLKLLQHLVLALCMSLLVWQVWKSPEEFWGQFVNVRWHNLTFVFLALAAGHLILTFRQVYMLRHAGISLPFWKLWTITYVGLFTNSFLPGGTGLDLTRLYYFKKISARSTSELGGIVLLDRLIGLCGLAVLVVPFIGTYYLMNKDILNLLWSRQFSIILLVLVPIAILSIVLLLRYQWLENMLTALLGRSAILRPFVGVMQTLKLYAKRRRLLAGTLLISCLNHFSAACGIYCIAYSLFDGTNALASMLLSPLVFLSSAIPVSPGNIGWTEAVAVFLWKLFAIQGGMLIFLFWRVLCAIYSLGGGVAYVLLGRSNRGFNAKPVAGTGDAHDDG